MGELTEDLIDEIVLRLPVKTLLQFRCVSKHFCSLIDSNNFIKKHLTHSVLTKTNQTLILQFRCVSKHFCSSIDSNNFIKKHLTHSVLTKTNQTLILQTRSRKTLYSVEISTLDQALELVQPINPNRFGTKFFGSCNGLLCLLYYCSGFVFIIWNPATRKHVKASVPEFVFTEKDVIVHGFGYDRVSDDYKIVTLHQFYSPERSLIRSVTYVYTMRSDSWRKLEDVATAEFLVFVKFHGALACGAIHWVMARRRSDIETLRVVVVGAFDLTTDGYRMLTLPSLLIRNETCMLLSELGGCLCYVFRHSDDWVVDVWVMKEYGVVESWTKLLAFSDLDVDRNIDSYVTPLVYSEGGDEVLLTVNSKRLMWYNLQKRTSRFVDIRGLPIYAKVSNYSESLVSLGNKSEKDEKQHVGAKAKQKDEFLSVGFKLVL